MNCQEARRELHEAARPDEVVSAALQQHLGSCAGCRAVREELAGLREGLRLLPASPVPEGFELALRRRLRAEADQVRAGEAGSSEERAEGKRSWLERVLPLAAAASLLLAIAALTSFAILRLRTTPAGSSQSFALHLSIDAAEDHRGALFDVELPSGIRLTPAAATALRGSDTRVSWQSRLRPGRNEIDLPLLVDRPGALRVALRAGRRSLATTVHVGASSASRPGTVVVAWRLEAGSPREVHQ